LDAAERVMAADGFEAATLARVVEESGVPMSSVYHFYGSKDGILLAVMERGARQFFADLPDVDHRVGRPAEHLRRVVLTTIQTLERHPNFLRLLVVFAVQPPRFGGGRVKAMFGQVREVALGLLRRQIAMAFGDDPESSITGQLARLALAAFDGGFVASQCDAGVTLQQILEALPASLVAARRKLLSQAQDG
jgi:AcrR family transcriptional regulator